MCVYVCPLIHIIVTEMCPYKEGRLLHVFAATLRKPSIQGAYKVDYGILGVATFTVFTFAVGWGW